jgi:hypothetical protein
MRAFMVNSSPSSAQTSPSNPGENQGNILTFQTCRQARTANFFDTDRGPMRISSYVSMRYVATVEEILRSDLSSTVDDGASACLSLIFSRFCVVMYYFLLLIVWRLEARDHDRWSP